MKSDVFPTEKVMFSLAKQKNLLVLFKKIFGYVFCKFPFNTTIISNSYPIN